MKQKLAIYLMRFRQLKTSEQRLLLGLSAFLFCLLVYGLIWQPVHQFQADQLKERERQLALLTMMKQTEGQARALLGQSGNKPFEGNLLTVITNATSQLGITPNRMQPEGDSVSLWFEQVGFAELMTLTDALRREQSVGLDQMVVDRTEDPGKVRARLVLSR